MRRLAVALALASLALAGCSQPPAPVDEGRDGTAVAETKADGEQDGRQGGKPKKGPGKRDPLVIRFLDVGQSAATLLSVGKTHVLVDAGRHDRTDVLSYLDQYGVDRLAVAAGTNSDADHIGQLPQVIESYDPKVVMLPGTVKTTAVFARTITAIENSSAVYEEPRAGDTSKVGPLLFEFAGPTTITDDANDDSLVFRVTYGKFKILFTGDAEARGEAAAVAHGGLDADIYVVGHHGSATSSSAPLISAVTPEVAVYSAGLGNQYGHPSPDTVSQLRAAGAEVYGTDIHGTVTVTTRGRGYKVSTERQGEAVATTPQEPSKGCSAGQVDVNRASAAELEGISGVGEVLAQRIVASRPYATLDDLDRVEGIGPATVAAIKSGGTACVSQ